MEKKINPIIAILDSGIGGVAVLRSIIAKNKVGNFIYFADNAFMPYGNKTNQELSHHLNDVCEMLFHKYNVNYIIVACNTASSCLKDNKNPNIFTMKFDKNYKYLATPLTAKNLSDFNIIQDNTLAFEIENNIFNMKKIIEIVAHHVQIHHLSSEKRVVLGCTHYELVCPILERFYPNTEFINNSELMLNDIKFEMDNNEFNIAILTSKKDKALEDKILNLLNRPTLFAD